MLTLASCGFASCGGLHFYSGRRGPDFFSLRHYKVTQVGIRVGETGAIGVFTEGPLGTHTRVCLLTDMADLQMKLLRKKIQKRSEKNKERKLRQKQREADEEEENGNVEADVSEFELICELSGWLAKLAWEAC